jgi:hypothetical protein
MGKHITESTRYSWSKENIKKAIQLFNVPRTTLRRRVEDKNINATFDKQNLGSRRPIVSPQQEEELKNHILRMQASHYGLKI